MTRLPRVDPDGARWRRRLVVPFFSTRPGTWYLTKAAPWIDARVTPRTRGWIGSLPTTSLLLMTCTGARSGLPRTTPLVFFSRGDDVIVMASNFGRPQPPAWLANVRANPDVVLQFRGRTGRYRARVSTGAEREELWATAKRYVPNYGDYESRTQGREIAVVVCEYAGS